MQAQPIQSTDRLRVLVVDDDPSVCMLVDRVLTSRGWAVTVARSAEEAGDVVVLSHWDAVLIDKNLPRLSGVDFAARVRQQQQDAGIVLMTAQPEASSRQGAWDAYLPKPFRSLDELVHSLDTARERRRRSREVDALKEKLSIVRATLGPPPGTTRH
ncbi:MAG: response regulator [Myxococcota bacterium]